MKKIFLIPFLLSVLLVTGFAVSLGEFLSQTLENSTDYELEQLSSVIAEMDYEKALIESATQRALLSAENTYYNALERSRTNMKNIFGASLDSLFAVFTTRLSYSVAELQLENSRNTLDNRRNLFERRLIAPHELEQAELDVESTTLSLIRALSNMQKAENDFGAIAPGMDHTLVILDIPNPEELLFDDEKYVKFSYFAMIQKTNLEIARIDFDSLSGLASEYDRVSAELRLKEAEISAEKSLKDAVQAHREMVESITNSYQSLIIADKKLEITRNSLQDTEERFRRGLISKTEYNSAKIQFMNEESSYLDSLRSYYKSLINYLIDTDRSPAGVLK